MKKLTALFVTILLFGCTQPPKVMTDYFGRKAVRLNSERVDGFQSLLKNPTSMTIADSFFVFTDQYDGMQFTVLDKSHPKEIKRFGSLGRGPGEFTIASPPQYDRQNSVLHFYALNERNWFSYSIQSLVADSSYRPLISHLYVPKTIGILNTVIPIKNQLFVCSGWLHDGKYAILSPDGSVNEVFGTNKIEPELQAIDEYTLNDLFQGRIKKHPNEQKFAYASIGSDLIEVVDVNDVNKPVISRRFTYAPQIDRTINPFRTSRDNLFGYAAFEVTEKYIYVVYSGKNLSKGLQFLQQGNVLFVFDWQLKPVVAYLLDHEISFMAVTEDDKYLYSAIVIDNEVELLYWSLNH
jgi:hypothetical protein